MGVLLGMTVLCVSACGSSRQVVKTDSSSIIQDSRDSVRVEQILVAVHDSLTITKTITIRENENGDTIRVNMVTDRERIRDRAAVKDVEEKVVVKTDTVYIAVRDSTSVTTAASAPSASRTSTFISALKWVFWIIVCVTVFIIVLKVTRVFNLF